MKTSRSNDPVEAMTEDDFGAPAELFVLKRSGARNSGLSYRRFDTASEAIECALADYKALRPDDVVMTVNDKRFNLGAMRALDPANPAGEPAAPRQDAPARPSPTE